MAAAVAVAGSVALIGPLAWEFQYATVVALKKKKKGKQFLVLSEKQHGTVFQIWTLEPECLSSSPSAAS